MENTMGISISDIPEEIHMFILSRLDGQSLVRAKRTCKMWACLIENLEKFFGIWLMCCLNEIPLFMLTEIMGYNQKKTDHKILIKSCKQLPWIFWREIYAEYKRAFTIEWAKMEMADLYYDQAHSVITSLAIKDGKLLTGHEDGSVFCWKNVAMEGLDLKLVHKHQRRVTCMAVTTTCTDVSELLSSKCHTLIVTGSQDYGVFVSDMTKSNSTELDYYNLQINSVSCFGPYITSVANGSFVQGQSVWHVSTEGSLTVTQESKLEPPDNYSNPVHVALTEDRVFVVEENGGLYRWTWNDGIPNKSVVITNLSCPVKSLICKDDCLVCLLDNGELEVTDSKSSYHRKWNINELLQRQPESMAWRGPLFALGTKGGVVYMYLVKDIENMKSLDLTKPAAKLTVEADHVNHIAIGDDGSSPLVAIATEQLHLSLFKFIK
ncbi:uncharacterized protein LOC143085380 [Mytilus galloprovincialis]|uniref:uncharacterized protein LOC143085380 n=1 Tax=Mytilus galloprovincialis TaxID=29158 RepID=UPI003F7BE6F7